MEKSEIKNVASMSSKPAAVSVDQAASRLHLLSLPGEVRNLIYRNIFTPKCPGKYVWILATCKTFRVEAMHIAYKNLLLDLTSSTKLPTHKEKLQRIQAVAEAMNYVPRQIRVLVQYVRACPTVESTFISLGFLTRVTELELREDVLNHHGRSSYRNAHVVAMDLQCCLFDLYISNIPAKRVVLFTCFAPVMLSKFLNILSREFQVGFPGQEWQLVTQQPCAGVESRSREFTVRISPKGGTSGVKRRSTFVMEVHPVYE